MRTFLILGSLITATACGGATEGDGNGTTPGYDGARGAASAKVEIRVRASTSPVSHDDGLAGQTPSDQRIGIRRLTLLRSATDPTPLVVFDHAATAVEVGLNDQDDTVVATVPVAALKAGNYTIARVSVTHVRYSVAATMHGPDRLVAGTFNNTQVLSDGVLLDGEQRNKGYYRFSFEVGGSPVAEQVGDEGPLPRAPSSGGITTEIADTETAYVFPVDVGVPSKIAGDAKLTFEINAHESFRWRDEPAAGYRTGVFDVTPTSYEPVERFGASSFRLLAELPPEAPSSNDSYTCPPNGTINCMPVVPMERQHLCGGSYAAWVKKNCPGVRYTY